MVCRRCYLGIDDDQDGNCAVCVGWSVDQLRRVIHNLRPEIRVFMGIGPHPTPLLTGKEPMSLKTKDVTFSSNVTSENRSKNSFRNSFPKS